MSRQQGWMRRQEVIFMSWYITIFITIKSVWYSRMALRRLTSYLSEYSFGSWQLSREMFNVHDTEEGGWLACDLFSMILCSRRLVAMVAMSLSPIRDFLDFETAKSWWVIRWSHVSLRKCRFLGFSLESLPTLSVMIICHYSCGLSWYLRTFI